MESQISNNADTGIGMEVNGNYGFTAISTDIHGTALANPITISQGDWIVAADSPKDVNGAKIWRPSLEEDVNGYTGDELVAPGETPTIVPTPAQPPATPTPAPAIPPFPCVGALHTVHLVDTRAAATFDLTHPTTTSGIYNPGYMSAGGTPFEGTRKPLCDTQLVTVRNGRSATPNFAWIPQSWVPLPSRIFGLVVDDLNLSTNPKELFFGEKYGIPNLPIGIYDFSDRLIKTINTDPNGMFEVELPSTTISDCPSPASVCPGMYRYLANDPGQPGHPNANYNPAYRTIGAFFESWPGISGPADLAPVPAALSIELPGTTTRTLIACTLNDPSGSSAPLVPELFAINRPYVRAADTGSARQFTINGQGFGAGQGAGRVTLDGVAMPITSWSATQVVFTVPAAAAPGAHQLLVTGGDGQTTVNGLTFHVLGTGYSPSVLEVGPGKTYDPSAPAHNTGGYEHAIQDALDTAAASAQALVVVYPGPTGSFNPLGGYFENVIMHSPVKLQGVGPGGIRADASVVPGSVLDGLGFGTDSARDTGWQATLAALGAIQAPATAAAPEGEVVLAVATSSTQYGSSYKAGVDGLLVQNGDVMDFNANFSNVGNGPTAFPEIGATPATPDQGGGIVAFDATRYLQITNNIIRSNTGSYGGAIRAGTPTVGSNNLPGLHIAHNRILNNGGNNLAGAVGIFAGATGYELDHNDVCGNFSAEYGGAVSHFGLSGGSSIHDNRIYFNGSYDEGGGVIVAGEPPIAPALVSDGAGAVDVYSNLIEGNLANDDGGGLRFLTAGNSPFNVYNNIIANNISTHEGGGVAIDNAPNVRFFNNTVMKNLTTATAATSNGQPAPAGLSTAPNDTFLQATLPTGSPAYSNPLMFNNIFWDNRAGSWDVANGVIRGVGSADLAGTQDATAINWWDMGVPGTSFSLSPTNSVLTANANPGVSPAAISDSSNHIGNPGTGLRVGPTTPPVVPNYPQVVDPSFTTTIAALPWRGNPNFIANVIVAQDVPVTIMGNYHLAGTGSPAVNAGAASKAAPAYQQPPATLAAPTSDIDGDARPSNGAFEIGADELHQATTNLSITKTDGVTSVTPGGAVTYTIVVTNAGPDAATGAAVADTPPASLGSVTWTCTASAGGSCGAASGSGPIATTISLPAGGAATLVLMGTLAANASGTLANTATVTAATGALDPNTANNSATDSDAIAAGIPTLTVLDDFNRANATTLGANWSQVTLGGAAAVRVNTNQAFSNLVPGHALWNGAGNVFGNRQAAAFTFANAPANGTDLYLKASGGSASQPANFIRVETAGTPAGTAVVVATTTNSGLTFNTRATFTGAGLAAGDTLTAVALQTGAVTVYRTRAGVSTVIGTVTIPTAGAGAWTQGTGGGRIGIRLPGGARIDNFGGGTVP